jgi:hypothetical protein
MLPLGEGAPKRLSEAANPLCNKVLVSQKPDPGTQFGCTMLLEWGKNPEVYISHFYQKTGEGDS